MEDTRIEIVLQKTISVEVGQDTGSWEIGGNKALKRVLRARGVEIQRRPRHDARARYCSLTISSLRGMGSQATPGLVRGQQCPGRRLCWAQGLQRVCSEGAKRPERRHGVVRCASPRWRGMA